MIHATDVVNASTLDEIYLLTADVNCNITSRLRYDQNSDDQFAQRLIQESSGGWSMLGNSGSNLGIYVTTNPDLSFNEAYEMNGFGSYIYDGVAVGNNKIIVGRTENTTGFISEVRPGGSILWSSQIPEIDFLYRIEGPYLVNTSAGDKNVFFALGRGVVQNIVRTVVYRFEANAIGGVVSPATLVWSKHLENSETNYSAGDIDLFSTNAPVLPRPTYLAYVDGRLDSPVGFGDHDVLAGILDLDLSSCITKDIDHTLEDYPYTLTPRQVAVTELNPPPSIDWDIAQPFDYQMNDPCEGERNCGEAVVTCFAGFAVNNNPIEVRLFLANIGPEQAEQTSIIPHLGTTKI